MHELAKYPAANWRIIAPELDTDPKCAQNSPVDFYFSWTADPGVDLALGELPLCVA